MYKYMSKDITNATFRDTTEACHNAVTTAYSTSV